MKYKKLKHTTDLKLKVFGQNLDELFSNAALALFDCIETRKNFAQIPENKSHKIKITSTDLEALLVDWLSELLYLHDLHNENYFNIKINKLTKKQIIAQVRGIPCHQDKFDVKAATYHELNIQKTDQGYEAVILFDI